MDSTLIEINRNYILTDKENKNDSDLFSFYDNEKSSIKDITYFKKKFAKNVKNYEYKKSMVRMYHNDLDLNVVRNDTTQREIDLVSSMAQQTNVYHTDKKHLEDLDGEFKVFSEHIVWAPKNVTEPLPCYIYFTGGGPGCALQGLLLFEKRNLNYYDGGIDTTINNSFNWDLNSTTNIQLDGNPPLVTLSHMHGYVSIFMNGFFGLDTNQPTDSIPRKYRSPPWWFYDSTRIKYQDLSDMLEKVNTNICPIQKHNITVIGFSVGGRPVYHLMNEIATSKSTHLEYLFSSFASIAPNSFEESLGIMQDYGRKYKNLTGKSVNFTFEIGSDDKIYEASQYRFKHFVDNFWTDDVTSYSAHYFDDLPLYRVMNVDSIKDDNYQGHLYKTKFRDDDNVNFFLIYTHGGGHSYFAIDENALELGNQWPGRDGNYNWNAKREFYSWQKYMFINDTNEIIL